MSGAINPEALGLRGKSSPTAGAVSLGFLPLRLADASVHDSRFGFARLGGFAATGALLELGGSLGVVIGLSLESACEQFFGEDVLDGDDGVFDFGESGPHSGPWGPQMRSMRFLAPLSSRDRAAWTGDDGGWTVDIRGSR